MQRNASFTKDFPWVEEEKEEKEEEDEEEEELV